MGYTKKEFWSRVEEIESHTWDMIDGFYDFEEYKKEFFYKTDEELRDYLLELYKENLGDNLAAEFMENLNINYEEFRKFTD